MILLVKHYAGFICYVNGEYLGMIEERCSNSVCCVKNIFLNITSDFLFYGYKHLLGGHNGYLNSFGVYLTYI